MPFSHFLPGDMDSVGVPSVCRAPEKFKQFNKCSGAVGVVGAVLLSGQSSLSGALEQSGH